MPAAPKSPRANKKVTSITKPKGAVRAKSGCYTCRIRRKKCDEKRVGGDGDRCETCIRLKLECLGFGAKRPDWLRESHRVSQIRDRIKAHLAAQGMIKGHAGSGSRNPVQDEILMLSDYREGETANYHRSGTSSSNSSPSPRDASVESDRPYASGRLTLQQMTSSVRGFYDYHPPRDDTFYHPHHDFQSSRCDSPSDSMMYHEHDNNDFYQPMEELYAMTPETPATKSSFSKFYHLQLPDEFQPEIPFNPLNPNHPSINFIVPSLLVPLELIDKSMHEYVTNIVKIQYLLGDRDTLPTMVWQAISTHSASQEAVRLLSTLYSARQDNRRLSLQHDTSIKNRIASLQDVLNDAKASFTADDAMAALHVVSLYLFDGGMGRWHDFLSFAYTYTESVLNNPRYYNNPSAALEAANPKDEFVVKTTIWFDVLASITTQRPPHLINYIRDLFSPQKSWVGTPPKYSMLSPMGCENTIVWALAETSYLSYWKHRHERQGDLSIRELVYKVQEIEPYLAEGPHPKRPQQTAEDWSRHLASEIFRTSTKLFLKSVESGDFPHVEDIKTCVHATFRAILDYPTGLGDIRPAIVRSTVFGIFICGSLTDREDDLRVLSLHLEQNSGHEGVGNCVAISALLRKLWDMRKLQPPSKPVQWRKLLNEAEILLV